MDVRAAVLRGPEAAFTLENVSLEDPQPGEVLVKVSGVGFCHTDLLARHAPLELPAIYGHEASGVVEAVGAGVTRVAPGDHVVLSYDSCGGCESCVDGEPSGCAQFGLRNNYGRRPDGTTPVTDGAGHEVAARWFGQSSFADHAISTERNTVKVDDDLPLETLGPLGCGVQTGAASMLLGLQVRAGTKVAIFGGGAVGLSAVMAARLAGAVDIVVVDLHQSRLDLAVELGATRVVDGSDPDVVALLRDGVGDGFDVSFDTTGSPAVVSTALQVLTNRGRCGLVGIGPDLTIPLEILVGRSVTYLLEGGADPQAFIPRLLGLWRRGLFPFEQLITTYPLDQINQAEADSLAGTTVKPVLVPASA